jgi:hypothetical protein
VTRYPWSHASRTVKGEALDNVRALNNFARYAMLGELGSLSSSNRAGRILHDGMNFDAARSQTSSGGRAASNSASRITNGAASLPAAAFFSSGPTEP